MDFYDTLSATYDAMTRFRQRVETERNVMRGWIDRFGFTSALDAACGTGLHAVALAREGAAVTGADVSAGMLARARENAGEYGVAFETAKAPMQSVGEVCPGPFDAVLCLGNSLPHLLSSGDLAAALKQFREVLAPGGVLGIQLLNYEKVLHAKERIVGIHRDGDTEFIRFYDFPGRTVRFNVLTVTWDGDTARQQLVSTELYPYTRDELAPALAGAGFTGLEWYGSMAFDPFDAAASGNLVLTAHPA